VTTRHSAPHAPSDKRKHFTCRLRNSIRTALEKVAAEENCSVSHAHEQLLEVGLALRPAPAIANLIALAIDSLPKAQHYSAVARRAVAERAIELEATYSRRRQPRSPGDDEAMGRVAFEMLWDEMRRIDPDSPNLTLQQQYLLVLRDQLGDLVDRAVVLGVSGKEVKEHNKALSRAEFDELRALTLEAFPLGQPIKPGKTPGFFEPSRRLSPAKYKRHMELYARWSLGRKS
jgi:hypothetical protein